MNETQVTITTNPAEIAALIEADTQAQENQTMNTGTTTPTPEPKEPQIGDEIAALGLLMFDGLMPLINRIVEAKFAQHVASHSTLKQMDETMTDRIREIAEEVLSEHTNEYDHDTYDNYDRTLDRLSQEIEDIERNTPDRDSVQEMVGDYLNENLSDEINTLLQNATATVEISV